MTSLPIPDRQSPISYEDIQWQEHNLGRMVAALTHGRIPATHRAHLDPDLVAGHLPRSPEWRPVFGQTGAAQGHLRNQGVCAGDVFLFFGLFREVLYSNDRLVWRPGAPARHVLWGWLQVERIVRVDDRTTRADWMAYHPHCHRPVDINNTLYVAGEALQINGTAQQGLPGAGVFPRFSPRLALTAANAMRPGLWLLPDWLFPRPDARPLTYHAAPARWQRHSDGILLDVAARGQEFLFHVADHPEAARWLCDLLCTHGGHLPDTISLH